MVVGGLVAKSWLTLATPWTEEPGRLQSMGFFRQEYWSGLPFPSPGDLPNPEIKPGSPVYRRILYQLSYKGSSRREGGAWESTGGLFFSPSHGFENVQAVCKALLTQLSH